MSREERSGWRDAWLSTRHREMWGVDCPMVDIDGFVAAEYDNQTVRALIEYKHHATTRWPVHADSNVHALKTMYTNVDGRLCRVPLFAVRYWPESITGSPTFQVAPLNDTARELVPDGQAPWPELWFVDFLYRLVRRRTVPDDVLARLDATRCVECVNVTYTKHATDGRCTDCSWPLPHQPLPSRRGSTSTQERVQ